MMIVVGNLEKSESRIDILLLAALMFSTAINLLSM
jgi:hypothetical protein